jgi:hypothetical protein
VCRVNGNLNLSRAIGDLKYKTNQTLEAKDQIITAQPDVRKVELAPEVRRPGYPARRSSVGVPLPAAATLRAAFCAALVGRGGKASAAFAYATRTNACARAHTPARTPRNERAAPSYPHPHPQPQPQDEFFLLACDGVWDVMTNQDAVDFLRARLQQGASPTDAAAALLDACLASDPKESRGVGCDNMTAIVVVLQRDGAAAAAAVAAGEAAAAGGAAAGGEAAAGGAAADGAVASGGEAATG